MYGIQRRRGNPLGVGQPEQPMMPTTDVPNIAIPAQMITDTQAEPEIDPMRKRLAEAILKATSSPEGEQEETLHPMQAIGNAAQQISSAYLKRKFQPNG